MWRYRTHYEVTNKDVGSELEWWGKLIIQVQASRQAGTGLEIPIKGMLTTCVESILGVFESWKDTYNMWGVYGMLNGNSTADSKL